MKLRFLLFSMVAAMLAIIPSVVPPTFAQSDLQHIQVEVKRFEFSPNEITVKKDQPVVIELKALDATHGLSLKDFQVEAKVDKGQTKEITFTPDKTGDFQGQCAVFCGMGHGHMKFIVHVVE